MTNTSSGPAPAQLPRGNQFDRVGDRKRILRIWQTAQVGPGRHNLEYMQFGGDDLRPVLFLHSLEYPNAPAWGYCVDAAKDGFGTFAIRRPGFGDSDRASNLEAQVNLIAAFIEQAELRNVVLVAVGSGCPAGYRLAARSPHISYSVYINCVFNRDIMSEFRPQWLAPIFSQSIQNRAGAKLSLAAVRQLAKQFGENRFYETVVQKSPGDVSFVRTFHKDVAEGWAIGSAIHSDTFRDEIRYSLNDDPFLTDGVLSPFRGIALSGAETTASWRSGFEAESRRVAIPFGYLPSGDIFAAYQSGPALLELIRNNA